MLNYAIDILEEEIKEISPQVLEILLKDKTTKKNIIWATNNYSVHGYKFGFDAQITIDSVTGFHSNVVKPRTEKTKENQMMRIREKAEVFTPSWVCNKQNNLVDHAWFGYNDVFNIERENTWDSIKKSIKFPTVSGKTWKDYVLEPRLEISCGEAPYLVSRYDTVTGQYIEISERIGLLDRKLRVLSENVNDKEEWLNWSYKAYKSIYGYDWQGDNVLLARENLLCTFIDYYVFKFHKEPGEELLLNIAFILSWNIWQMDGLKLVVPDSCKDKSDNIVQLSLFDAPVENKPCEGCAKNDHLIHTGIYCKVMDWGENKEIKFVSLLNKNSGGKS
ncbi:MAG TPA: restriction endonuclease subunit M [Clostridiales bacterium]|nr:restriction endonuclease subunit M [Clostridiales bacterium]